MSIVSDPFKSMLTFYFESFPYSRCPLLWVTCDWVGSVMLMFIVRITVVKSIGSLYLFSTFSITIILCCDQYPVFVTEEYLPRNKTKDHLCFLEHCFFFCRIRIENISLLKSFSLGHAQNILCFR